MSALEDWRKAVSEAPKDVQERLFGIHHRAIAIVIRHMAIGSPLLFVLICLFVVFEYFKGTAKKGERLTADLPGIDIWEKQVVDEDRADRKGDREEAFA